MKKVLSILLAVLMIASTVAITGIVSSSAADTNPSDDAYVYVSSASDARKSGFAYDFTNFTIDPANLANYTAEMWIYIGRQKADVAPTYDFLLSLYPEGYLKSDVGANYSEYWALRKEWKTGNLEEGWNKVTLTLDQFAKGSTGNTYNKEAYTAFESTGSISALTLHENSANGAAIYGSTNIGVSSFVITDGTNTYNVVDPAATKSSSDLMKQRVDGTQISTPVAQMIDDLYVPFDAEEKIILISPYGEKSVDDMYQAATSKEEEFSVVDTATLTGGTEGVPGDKAYYVNQINGMAKSTALIKVGGEDGIKISNLYDDFMNGQLYFNAWVWVDDPSTDNMILRMYERRDNTSSSATPCDNYMEYNLTNNGVGVLTQGWNYITANITAVIKGAVNAYHGQAFQAFANMQTIQYIALYYHNTSLCDVAVAAAELSTEKGNSDWDVSIEGKKTVYKNGNQPVAEDFIVTDKGVVVDPANYTVGTYDSEIAGRQFIKITYNSNDYYYEIYNKTTLGQSTYHTTYSGESSVIAGNRNGDNAVIGTSSVQHTAAGTAVSYHVATEALNLYGEDFLEMYIYFQKDMVDAMKADEAADAIQLFVEMDSGTGGKNGIRILLYDTFFIGQGVKAGWNKVYIPLNPGTTGASADSAQVGGVATNWVHDGQTSGSGNMYMDYESVKNFRIRYGKFAGTVSLINAVGYGMDISVDGRHAGNDINEAIKSAKAGSTVKLNWKNSMSESINVDKNITFDFNGNDVSTTAGKVVALNGGNITVVDTNTKYNYSVSGAKVYPANKGEFVAKSSATIFTGTGSETAYLNGTWTQKVTDGTVKIAGNAMFPYNETYKAGISEMTKADADGLGIFYEGNWQALSNLAGANDKTLMRSTDEGDAYLIVFNGTAIAINGYTSPTYGKIEVFIDGTSYGTIDLYSAEVAYQKHIFGAVVEDGLHELKVVALGTKNASATRPTLFYNAIDSVEVVGHINNLAESGIELSEMNVDLNKNTAVFKIDNVQVNGLEKNGLVATAEKGKVTVDGNLIRFQACSMEDTITYYINGVKGVINVTIPEGTRIEAEVAAKTYKNGQLVDNKVKNARLHSGAAALKFYEGESVEFKFYGTGFDLIAYKSANLGRINIFVDNDTTVATKIVNLTSTTVDVDFQKTVYTLDGLEEGEHTVRIEVRSGVKSYIDAFVVRNEPAQVLRVASYNIANGSKCSHNFQALADDIINNNIDIVGLQEVDLNSGRSTNIDIAKKLAELTGFNYYYFTKAIDLPTSIGGEYGIAIISKYPISNPSSIQLTSNGYEQRVAQKVQIDVNGKTVNFVNTHFSWENAATRTTQFAELQNFVSGLENVIVTGDFNIEAVSEFDQVTTLSKVNTTSTPHETWNVDDGWPTNCIDNIMYSSEFEFTESGVYTTTKNSDHYMLYAELAF